MKRRTRVVTAEIYIKDNGTGEFRVVDGRDHAMISLKNGGVVTMVDDRKNRLWYLDLLALYMLAFGVWPLAAPNHDMETALSTYDVVVHWAGAAWLAFRYRAIRRPWPRT